MAVAAVYRQEPNWPATQDRPRYQKVVAGKTYWVETTGDDPTDADVLAVIDPPPSPELVKAEAKRRILASYPEWKQANMTARGVELMRIRMSRAWTADEQSEADALQAAWDWIKGIRTKSNALEAMRPIPADFANEKWWTP